MAKDKVEELRVELEESIARARQARALQRRQRALVSVAAFEAELPEPKPVDLRVPHAVLEDQLLLF